MNRAIALVLSAAVAAACSQVTATGTPPSEPSSSPSGSPATPPLEASAAPTITVGPVTLAFERAADVHDTAELYAITAYEGGFVAGGCRLRTPTTAGSEGGCAHAYALLSHDGSSWSEVPLPNSSDVAILGLSDTPLGVLALGATQHSEPPQARTIWRLAAADRWELFQMPAPSSIVFKKTALVNGRTVFLGFDTAFDLSTDTEAWTTADGTSWTHGTTPVSPKVAAEPGLVVVGSQCVDVCETDPQTRLYRSTDAITWTEGAVPSELATTSVEAIAAWDGRAIVGGSLDGGSVSGAVIWLDDPAGWRQIGLPDGAGYAVSSLIVSAQGMIAIGRSLEDDRQAAWWSTDGVTWDPVQLEGIGKSYVAASAAGSRLVVIVNYDSIWVSAF